MTQDLLTPQQVADLLQVKTDTLEAWRGKRTGPAWIKLGDGKRSPVRYRKADIDAYLKARSA
jgi:predicted DNA-binding transcriptional regulator AlpA